MHTFTSVIAKGLKAKSVSYEYCIEDKGTYIQNT